MAVDVVPSFLAKGCPGRGEELGEDPFLVSRETATCSHSLIVPVISPRSGISVNKTKFRAILKSLNFCFREIDSLF